ncbi:hypothetical protein IJG11_01330 [Candidatus Saccharibacteria bacterium]|uniref:DUF5640 domain-containing protein n=1 Tax=Candidatus Nanosyncoccus alces TaxID=2171997 RepID=A0ABY0FMR2_9BACT|nr:DUF5640 domain-containing protein [Candidatus Nanosyncoccus alces]MBQ2643543.1 hypothetical protein [Candidatus Saccharibacteria bacterium]RYC74473.1 hypothetical protein G3RUM_00628 [Candidatus Nanosyncoccus alces]
MNKRRVSLIVFIIGIVTLVAGVVFLIVRLNTGPSVQDGEFLVSVGEWQEESEPGVIWNFTEIGKGTLTTNNHTNDYDFSWALEDNKIKIDTEWLYTLSDEFGYELDQNGSVLTITKDDEEIRFIPVNN